MLNKIGICNAEGQTLCSMKIGSDNLDITRNGKHFYTLLNRRAVLESKSEKEIINRASPVISTLIKVLCKQGNLKEVKVTKGKNYTEMIDSIIKNISDNPSNAEISVLTMVPDEIQENTPPETTTANFKKISMIPESYLAISENVENIKHIAGILVKTNLSKDVWGAKEVTAMFHETKNNMDNMAETFEQMDGCIEQSNNLIRTLTASSNTSYARTVVGSIIDDFSTIKTALSELSQNLQGLYDVDSTFKKNTGYPATWFLNSSIFYDFLFEFETLLENLINLSKIENNTIGPLLVWKVTNGSKK